MSPQEIVKQFAKLLISQKITNQGVLVREDIAAFVKCDDNPRWKNLSEAEVARVISELEADYDTSIGSDRELIGADDNWQPWLGQRSGVVDWSYWLRYRQYLARSLASNVVEQMETSTARVLGLLGDPKAPGPWDRRGLVLGLVQSGKTSHYIGVINRAIDVGYDVVIVLTGFTESLRVQTQLRVEKGVLGYGLRREHGVGRNEAMGVKLIGNALLNVNTGTTIYDDFLTSVAQNFGIHVGGGQPLVFIVKKNATVLRNLLRWVRNFGTMRDTDGRFFVPDASLLVIDDESDVGSVDTSAGALDEFGDVDLDHEPARINKQIRQLLSLFNKSAYVGYTATPFANVLIHHRAEVGMDPMPDDPKAPLWVGPDLFPRSFMVSLPASSKHIGPTVLFGGQNHDGIPIVREITDVQQSLDPDRDWMPAKHFKNHQPLFNGSGAVPPSLRQAIMSFILVIAVRRLRGQDGVHNSMLVHVTRFVDVQRQVFEQVLLALSEIQQTLREQIGHRKLLAEFEGLWHGEDDAFVETATAVANSTAAASVGADACGRMPEWSAVSEVLRLAAESIQVKQINGNSGEVLDYELYSEGLNVIAIGGDKLSRGLTLEHLSVSYFLRSSKMYDTLMQMGRWFGYRPGYLDICRLYTTPMMSEWFTHIAEATEQLRGEFDLMAMRGGTPMDYGIRVRSHPVMLVTSQVKMRHGSPVQVSFQDTWMQTIDFLDDATAMEQNAAAASRLIEAARECDGDASKLLWRGIPAVKIVSFLRSYHGHPTAVKVQADRLADYIEAEVRSGRLDQWGVHLAGGQGANSTVGGVDTCAVQRAINLGNGSLVTRNRNREQLRRERHLRIKVLTSEGDQSCDLTREQRSSADLRYDALPRDPKSRLAAVPRGSFYRDERSISQGLLVLYLVDVTDEKVIINSRHCIGFALALPKVGLGDQNCITYITNSVDESLRAI